MRAHKEGGPADTSAVIAKSLPDPHRELICLMMVKTMLNLSQRRDLSGVVFDIFVVPADCVLIITLSELKVAYAVEAKALLSLGDAVGATNHQAPQKVRKDYHEYSIPSTCELAQY